jgi:hypothetical protein
MSQRCALSDLQRSAGRSLLAAPRARHAAATAAPPARARHRRRQLRAGCASLVRARRLPRQQSPAQRDYSFARHARRYLISGTRLARACPSAAARPLPAAAGGAAMDVEAHTPPAAAPGAPHAPPPGAAAALAPTHAAALLAVASPPPPPPPPAVLNPLFVPAPPARAAPPLDLEAGGDGARSDANGARVCRICLEESHAGSAARGGRGGGSSGRPPVPLSCACRGDMGAMHYECAQRWFVRRGADARARGARRGAPARPARHNVLALASRRHSGPLR